VLFLPIEGLDLTFEEDGVKECSPADAHQHDEATGTKTSSRPVVGFDCEKRALAGLVKVCYDFVGESRHSGGSPA